jgi:hypothetical protein
VCTTKPGKVYVFKEEKQLPSFHLENTHQAIYSSVLFGGLLWFFMFKNVFFDIKHCNDCNGTCWQFSAVVSSHMKTTMGRCHFTPLSPLQLIVQVVSSKQTAP